jgi:hypothetical protein
MASEDDLRPGNRRKDSVIHHFGTGEDHVKHTLFNRLLWCPFSRRLLRHLPHLPAHERIPVVGASFGHGGPVALQPTWQTPAPSPSEPASLYFRKVAEHDSATRATLGTPFILLTPISPVSIFSLLRGIDPGSCRGAFSDHR